MDEVNQSLELSPEILCRRCDPAHFTDTAAEELPTSPTLLGRSGL
jgi:hypothetical protein